MCKTVNTATVVNSATVVNTATVVNSATVVNTATVVSQTNTDAELFGTVGFQVPFDTLWVILGTILRVT